MKSNRPWPTCTFCIFVSVFLSVSQTKWCTCGHVVKPLVQLEESGLFHVSRALFPQITPYYPSFVLSSPSQAAVFRCALQSSLCPYSKNPGFTSLHRSLNLARLNRCWQWRNASHRSLIAFGSRTISNSDTCFLSKSLGVTPRRCWRWTEAIRSPRGPGSWSEWYSAWPGWDGFGCGISGAIFVAQFGPAKESTQGRILKFWMHINWCFHHVGSNVLEWNLLCIIYASTVTILGIQSPTKSTVPLTITLPTSGRVNLHTNRQLAANNFTHWIVYS